MAGRPKNPPAPEPQPGSFASQLVEIGKCAEELKAARADMIRKRRQQGATLRQIAAEAGLTHTAVAKILGS